MLCCALWGSAFPCVKIGYQLFGIGSADMASQILFAGCRFTLAGVMIVIGSSIFRRHLVVPKKRQWGTVAIIASVQTVLQYLFFYIGLARTSGVKASIIEGASTFFAILLAACIFRMERLSVAKIVGCVAGFAGVVLVNISGVSESLSFSLTGEGFILISAVAYALSSVLIKLYGKENDPVMLSGWQFLMGGVVLVIVGVSLGGRVAPTGGSSYLMLTYLAIISAVAYSVWGILLKYNPVSRVTVYGFMNPLFGVILSIWFLGEGGQAFGLKGYAALALVCIGIYIVNARKSD